MIQVAGLIVFKGCPVWPGGSCSLLSQLVSRLTARDVDMGGYPLEGDLSEFAAVGQDHVDEGRWISMGGKGLHG